MGETTEHPEAKELILLKKKIQHLVYSKSEKPVKDS